MTSHVHDSKRSFVVETAVCREDTALLSVRRQFWRVVQQEEARASGSVSHASSLRLVSRSRIRRPRRTAKWCGCTSRPRRALQMAAGGGERGRGVIRQSLRITVQRSLKIPRTHSHSRSLNPHSLYTARGVPWAEKLQCQEFGEMCGGGLRNVNGSLKIKVASTITRLRRSR